MYTLRSYYFALKIILTILNKLTQYISFISITLFITLFLIIKQGLFIYEDVFINSLKGLYPEFITSSSSTVKDIETKYIKGEINVENEVFVHSEEIEFSYDSWDDMTKYMNVRTYSEKYKEKLFSTIEGQGTCKESEKTIWMSSRLFDNMAQDTKFNKKSIFFRDEDDNYIEYEICKFKLDNNEKWLLLSTQTAKEIAYLPFTKYVLYTDNRDIKEKLHKESELNNWREYIDYDDLGLFLLAKEVSALFLSTFFIFLLSFMVITFSSLAKEFEASLFLIKIYGFNRYKTITLYTLFFLIYTICISVFVYVEYQIITYLVALITNFYMEFNFLLFSQIIQILITIGFFVSLFITIKYHRLPL